MTSVTVEVDHTSHCRWASPRDFGHQPVASLFTKATQNIRRNHSRLFEHVQNWPNIQHKNNIYFTTWRSWNCRHAQTCPSTADSQSGPWSHRARESCHRNPSKHSHNTSNIHHHIRRLAGFAANFYRHWRNLKNFWKSCTLYSRAQVCCEYSCTFLETAAILTRCHNANNDTKDNEDCNRLVSKSKLQTPVDIESYAAAVPETKSKCKKFFLNAKNFRIKFRKSVPVFCVLAHRTCVPGFVRIGHTL